MSESRSNVAVAIATRDRPAALGRCLRSLVDGRAVPGEIVVADQSDGTGTREVVDEVVDSLVVRYVRARPGGLGVAQNDAFAAASLPVVAVLDDDCIAGEDWLERVGQAFDQDPDLALLGGRVLPLGPPSPHRFAVSSRVSTVARTFTGKYAPWHVGSGNNFALRRSWFESIGGCDERLGPGAPLHGGLDMDLFYRVLRAGGKARYEPSVVVLHERTTQAGRLSRRHAYGYGTGAAVAIWVAGGDRFGWRILGSWVRMRTELLARALARGRWASAREETIVLRATAEGLGGGFRMVRSGRKSR
jgi:GT2 family glycosyltransferase